MVAIHRLGDTVPIGTLKRIFADAGWDDDALRRLKLTK